MIDVKWDVLKQDIRDALLMLILLPLMCLAFAISLPLAFLMIVGFIFVFSEALVSRYIGYDWQDGIGVHLVAAAIYTVFYLEYCVSRVEKNISKGEYL